jgi:hypothetical protein
MSLSKRTFIAEILRDKKGSYFVLPFVPDDVWGKKTVHHVAGTVGGQRYRGKVSDINGKPALVLGQAWLRGQSLSAGNKVEIVLSPEGPQRGQLDPDLAAALQMSPSAAIFFDGLAQFYRKGYLRWIAATKKSPEERKRRIADTVRFLEAGWKERPKS